MSAFGRFLGTALTVVVVSKIGLTVAYYGEHKGAEQTKAVVYNIDSNTPQMTDPHSHLLTEKKAATSDIALN